MSFKKDDKGKPQLSLLPEKGLIQVARVLEFGAERYGRDNWRKANLEDLTRYQDAAFRHLVAYANGASVDPDSGLSHMAHCACNALFLLEFEEVTSC